MQTVDVPAERNRPSPSATGKAALLLVLITGVMAFVYFDGARYVSLEALKVNRDRLAAFTEEHYPAAVVGYMVLYCLQTAFSLPGAAVLTLAGGFLFGTILGTLYVNIAATLGATLAFLAARYLLRDWVERKFGDRLSAVQEGFAKNAFHYLLTLRLIPVFPFFLVNLVSGLTRMDVGTFVAATAIGIIPGSFVFANAGRQLGSIDSLSDIASPRVLGAFALLGLLALVPVLYRRATGRIAS